MSNFPPITHAFLNLTNNCNLACRYCFVHQNPKKIDLQTAKDAANWLAKNAENSKNEIPSINFFGGEPLLMYDEIIKPLTEYIREKYKNRFKLTITTNGTLITEPKLKFMKQNSISPLLSIDGDRESQDWNRPLKNGNSSFDILQSKIPIILKYFPNTCFRSTITKKTSKNLFSNISYASSLGFKTFFAIPNCFEEWELSDIKELEKQMDKYIEYYSECIKKGRIPICIDQLEIVQFKNILRRNEAIINNYSRSFSSCKACKKCGLGSGKYASISLNGDLYTCQEFFSTEEPTFKIGNIYSGVDDEKRYQLSKLWEQTIFRTLECEDCPLDRICEGGCIANNFLYSNDIHIRPRIYCEWDKILFISAVKIVESVGEYPNFKKRWDFFVSKRSNNKSSVITN